MAQFDTVWRPNFLANHGPVASYYLSGNGCFTLRSGRPPRLLERDRGISEAWCAHGSKVGAVQWFAGPPPGTGQARDSARLQSRTRRMVAEPPAARHKKRC